MNAQEYCNQIEYKDLLHKKLERDFPIKDNGSRLVSLRKVGFHLIFEPSIMNDHMYMAREDLVEKIQRISAKLKQQAKTLVIRSAWRSFEHQRRLWEGAVTVMQRKFPQKKINEINEIVSHYIAPENKSTHSTGGAIDALIYDDETGEILNFGTNKGIKIDLGKKCYPYHPEISDQAKENRNLLIGLFEREDFVCDLKEYWHFDYGNVGWAIEKGKDHAIYGIIDPG